MGTQALIESELKATPNVTAPEQKGLKLLPPKEQYEIDAALEKLNGLDLSKIHLNLMDTGEGLGWTPEMCREIEARYRTFLLGKLVYPDEVFAPDKDVDQFWHYHILDTQAYAEDCQNLFGDYLHHNPYLGMEGEESIEELAAAWARTQELTALVNTSGMEQALADKAAFCGMGRVAFCGMGGEVAFCGTVEPDQSL